MDLGLFYAFTLLRFLTLMEWICANTVGRSKNLCYENVKKTWGFALVNKKLEKIGKKLNFGKNTKSFKIWQL